MSTFKARLETQQVPVYFTVVALGVACALFGPDTTGLDAVINPALAVMLYLTFLQVPLAELGRSLTHGRFLLALLTSNFVVVPLLVAGLWPAMPADDLLRFGLLLVLLAPCIDYVVSFAHLGRADARLLLAATPGLLIVQMLLLPLYLTLFLGASVGALVQPEPFVQAFVWLIALPLALAGLTQFWAGRHHAGRAVSALLAHLPVPATAAVLFVVVAAVVPRLGQAQDAALAALPFHVVFAVLAPLAGWSVARVLGLGAAAGRAVAFSTGTRNSLVVLPLALAVPGAMPVLPAVIVTQTLVELLAEVIYVRWIARFGAARPQTLKS